MAYLSSVSLYDSQTNLSPRVYPLLGLKTVEMRREGGVLFSGTTLDTFKHTLSGSAGGTGSVANGVIALSTGTSANGSVDLQTNHPFRYTAGRTMSGTVVAMFPDTGSSNNIRRFGFYTGSDGFYYQLSGSTFSIGSRKAGVDTLVNNGSFNGNIGSTYPLNTNLNKFEIYFSSHNTYWLVNDNMLHKIEYPSSSLTSTLTLPFQSENNNIAGNTTNNIVYLRLWGVESAGNGDVSNEYYNLNNTAETRTLKVGPGRLQRVSINNNGAGGNTLTLYDNTAGSGTILASIDITVAGQWQYDINFYTGLTYVATGTTANITISWE